MPFFLTRSCSDFGKKARESEKEDPKVIRVPFSEAPKKKERQEIERRIPMADLLFALAILAIVSGQFMFLPSAQGLSPVSAFLIFGDSSVNCGDNTFLYPFLQRNSSSYICNASDQPLVPDLLAEKMGLPAIPTFYGQNRTVEGLLGGLNFGSSPATIMNWGRARSGFQGLNQQLRQAFETLQLLQLQLGFDKTRELAESSLFYLSFGKDDYVELLHDLNGLRLRFGRKRFARMLANQMTRAVKDLYNANARKIVCMGIGPLGCTPRSLWEAYNSTLGFGGNCVDEINELIREYNRVLSLNLRRLSSKLRNAQIVFCDIYRGLMTIISDPDRYGLKDVKSACCGLGRYGGMVGCVEGVLACQDRWTHVWWDLYNPTEAANSLLANWTWSGSPHKICHPISIQQLAS